MGWFKCLRQRAGRGIATVEAALLLNMLVLLLAGVLEFGRVLDVWVITRNAAREGARLGAMGGTAAQIRSRVLTYLNTSLAGRTDVTLPAPTDIVVAGAGGPPGSSVAVGLATGVQIMTPLIEVFLPENPMPVSAGLTMRIQ